MTPAAVVDANVFVKWFIADQPFQAQADAVREQTRCFAPVLALTELANALWKYVRVGRIELSEALEAVAALPDACALTDDRMLVEVAQRLSAARDHPVYDCIYAALAIREGLPFITADERFARKFASMTDLHIVELSTVQV